MERWPADELRLPQRHLVIAEDAVLDDGKFRALAAHAVVVVADGGEPALLRALGHDGHQGAAELQAVEHFRQDEGCAGEIGLPAERPVELGRMARAFVDGQPQVRRVDDHVVDAGLDGLRGELLPRLRRGKRCLRLAVIAAHIFPACRARREQAVPRGEFAGLLIDGRDRELRPNPLRAWRMRLPRLLANSFSSRTIQRLELQ